MAPSLPRMLPSKSPAPAHGVSACVCDCDELVFELWLPLVLADVAPLVFWLVLVRVFFSWLLPPISQVLL
jgi:hypothetical protein